MAYIICLDTEPETVEALRSEGHTVETGEIGYRTGKPLFVSPPHECDFLICDLKKPACFNMKNWGPGGNDNFHCKIEKSITDDIFYNSSAHPQPVYQVIKHSQMSKLQPGAFGPSDVFKAVNEVGVPMLLFLNPEWIRHIGYGSPDFNGVIWHFEQTKATKFELVPILKEAFPEIEDSLHLELPLTFHIIRTELPKSSKDSLIVPLVKNKISQVFGEAILLKNGCIWALPQLNSNVALCNAVLRRLESFKDFQSSILEPEIVESKQIREYEEEDGEESRDLFISYASEDREAIARPLTDILIKKGLTVWFDKYELTLGDNLREKIEEGLRISRFGVTILSHSFFNKKWPKTELDGLFALETGSKKILPVWHGLSADDVRKYSPILASRLGISTSEGIEAVSEEIIKAVGKKK